MRVVNLPGSLYLSAMTAARCQTDIMSGPATLGSVSTDGSVFVACAPISSVTAAAASVPPALIMRLQRSTVLSPITAGLPL